MLTMKNKPINNSYSSNQIPIECVLFDTSVDGLQVVKTVVETKLPLENSQEFCIAVYVVDEILSETRFKIAERFNNIVFFGVTYDEANRKYLKWLNKVTKSKSNSNNNQLKLGCVLEALSL